MRSINSIRNIKYNLIFFGVNSILAFALRTVLINFIGPEITGIDEVLKNLISFLNVAELGIGMAITYSLYSPLSEGRYEEISSIVLLYKYIYRIVGVVVLFLAIIASFFIQYIIKSDVFSIQQIIILFFMYSSVTIISYFYSYSRVVAIADQKNYIISRITGIFNTSKILLQISCIIIFRSYFIMLLIEVIFNIASYLYINKTILNKYSWLIFENKKLKELIIEHKSIFNDIKNVFYHKIAGLVVFQTDNIMLSAFINLTTVTIYSNYVLITGLFSSLFMQIIVGIKSSIGNLIAERDNQKSYNIFIEINRIFDILGFVVCYCLYININNLVVLWIGEDMTFYMGIVFIILINLFIKIARNPVEAFKDGYGLFWDIYAPLAEAIINLIVSLILVKYIGVTGIVLGTFMSNFIIVIIWKPYMLFKYGFKLKMKNYLISKFKFVLISVCSIFISNLILREIDLNTGNMLVNLIKGSIISVSSVSISYYIISLLDYDHRVFYSKYLKKIKSLLKVNRAIN